jgi:hypothetical protein
MFGHALVDVSDPRHEGAILARAIPVPETSEDANT